jgi:hypothetical protein
MTDELSKIEQTAAADLAKAKADETAALAAVNTGTTWFKAHSLKIAIGAVAILVIIVCGLAAKHL